MTRTNSDLLLLLAATSGLRIGFDHGRRNRICIFFRILFHRFGLLLLLSFKNVGFKSLLLRWFSMPCDSDHASISFIWKAPALLDLLLEQLSLFQQLQLALSFRTQPSVLSTQSCNFSLNFLLHLTSQTLQFLPFRFRKADIELFVIVIGVIGFIVVVHPVGF